MRLIYTIALLGFGVVFASGLSPARATEDTHTHDHQAASVSHSQEATGEHSHEQAQLHGGSATMAGQYHFETVFSPDGIRVYKYTAEQAPLMTRGTKGEVTLKFAEGPGKTVPLAVVAPEEEEDNVFFCPMHPEVVQLEPGVCEKCGGMTLFVQDYLYAQVDLSKIAPGDMQVVVELQGLKGVKGETTFTMPFGGLTDGDTDAGQ